MTSLAGEKQAGILPKYDVARLNDADGKHDDCRYFVLDPQHDPIAVDALRMYAKVAREAGYIALAGDLEAWLIAARGATGCDTGTSSCATT